MSRDPKHSFQGKTQSYKRSSFLEAGTFFSTPAHSTRRPRLSLAAPGIGPTSPRVSARCSGGGSRRGRWDLGLVPDSPQSLKCTGSARAEALRARSSQAAAKKRIAATELPSARKEDATAVVTRFMGRGWPGVELSQATRYQQPKQKPRPQLLGA